MDTLTISSSRRPRLALITLSALVLIAAATAGCGGGGNTNGHSDGAVSIDTSALAGSDAIADAVAAEHGAPGENEPLRVVLTGSNATPEAVSALKERGFADVQVGAR